jgi:MSHA biogenesis protein MshJ
MSVASTNAEGSQNTPALQFYRHEFTVTLQGKYFDLAESLKALEAMDIKIYWDTLSYKVDQYPYADIQLTVYTFSYDKNWIGV